MAIDIRQVTDEVKNRYDAVESSIKITPVVENFLAGSVCYVEFAVASGEKDFCYAFADSKGVKLFPDGEEVIKAFQVMLDQRRSFWQRLNEFTLVELIGAIIALVVTGAFVVHSFCTKEIDRNFVAIFSLIAGYYFGKNVSPPR